MADWLFEGLEFVMHEATLFAATGFLLLGIGDLLVDLLWIGIVAKRRMLSTQGPALATELEPPAAPGRLAIFLPAWDESGVIDDMLRNTLRSFGHADYIIYVGCYPNDPATIAAVRAFADPRVRLVIGASGIM